jgi:hypothetical protein
MFDVDLFILRMIENCAPFVEKIYVAYSEFPWSYNPEAKERFKNPTNKDILKRSRFYNKIELIEGVWQLDEEQRNACLERAKADGFDYLIIHDADEFYLKKDYKKNLEEIAQNPEYDVYDTPWCSFWKTLGYVIQAKDGSIIIGHPEFAVNCHSHAQFVRARILNSNKKFRLPGLCYHLSWVLSDQHAWRKINTWGHSHEFNRVAWYKRKWLKWYEGTRNLHPVQPEAWPCAIKFQGELPEVLQCFPSPTLFQYQPSFFDRLEKCYERINSRFNRHLPTVSVIDKKIQIILSENKWWDTLKGTSFKLIGINNTKKLHQSINFSLQTTVNVFRQSKYFHRKFLSCLTWKYKVAFQKSKHGYIKLHLGCGDKRFGDMVNCEYRATAAADIVMDCGNLSRFKGNSVHLIFSHAFFEHLYKKQHISFLKDCYRVLTTEGILIFLGIPDFQVIAESYLKKAPGIKGVGNTFDIYHAYRYTHGDPEIAPSYWLEQLHKSLFDKAYVEDLLLKAGFGNYSIFNYCYPGEEIPINMGFAAFKGKPDKNIKELLFPFKEYFANLEGNFQFHLTSR